MYKPLAEWMEDVSQYAKTVVAWQKARRFGGGVDYTSAEFRGRVRRTVEALHPRRMKLRVVEKIAATSSTTTFRMVRVDGEVPPFRAGQYVNVFININGVHTSRPYSIASAPGGEHIDLTVRRNPGGFVAGHLLDNLAVDDAVETTGPMGSFYHEPLIDGEDLVFIAGGSGITPFMSMLRCMASKCWPARATLLYGSRKASDVIFGRELAALAKGNKNFRYVPVISEAPRNFKGERGFIDAKLLRRVLGEVAERTFYLCGPNAMYDFCLPQLAKLGVPAHRIKRELYGPPAKVVDQPGWPAGLVAGATATVRVNGRTIAAPVNEPLLNSLERHGVPVLAVCRSGECSACRVKKVSGDVYMPPTVGLREADAKFGYIHACVSYPLRDVVIQV